MLDCIINDSGQRECHSCHRHFIIEVPAQKHAWQADWYDHYFSWSTCHDELPATSPMSVLESVPRMSVHGHRGRIAMLIEAASTKFLPSAPGERRCAVARGPAWHDKSETSSLPRAGPRLARWLWRRVPRCWPATAQSWHGGMASRESPGCSSACAWHWSASCCRPELPEH